MGFDYFPPPYDTKKTPKENMKSLHDYDRQHKKSTVYTGLIFILSVVLLTIAMMLFAMIKCGRCTEEIVWQSISTKGQERGNNEKRTNSDKAKETQEKAGNATFKNN